jgi:hypothetical protein
MYATWKHLNHNMENTMASFNVSTRASAGETSKQTIVNVIYDDPQAERALATQALIVKAQGGWRKNGIPDNVTLKLSEYAPGTRHAGEPNYAALSPEERRALIAKLSAM